MTLEQALVIANKNLDKKNLRGFIVYTFHEDVSYFWRLVTCVACLKFKGAK